MQTLRYKLKNINNEMIKSMEKDNVKSFFKLDNQFHEVFLTACGNEKLCTLTNQLVQQFERFRITALALPGRMANSVKQHSEIIEAIEDRNETLAADLVKANAESNCDVLVSELMKEEPRTQP